MMEDPVLMPAAVTGKDTEAAIVQLERLALDSAELAAELHVFATGKLTTLFGKTPTEMIEEVLQRDPATVDDPDERATLETFRSLAASVDLTELASDVADMLKPGDQAE